MRMLEGSNRFRSLLPNSKACILIACGLTWAFSVTSVSRCTFVLQENTSGTTPTTEIGIFSRAVYDSNGSLLGCVSYTDTEPGFFDTMFKISRISGVFSSICSTIVLLFVSYAILFCPRSCKSLWSWSRFLLAAGTIGQLFTFSILNSTQCQGEDTCKLAGVGKLAILNVLLLAGLTVKLFWEDRPFNPSLYLRADALDTDTVASDRTSDPNAKSNCTVNRNTEDLQESGQVHYMEGRMSTSHTRNVPGSADSTSVQESEANQLSIQHLRSFRFLTMLLVALAWTISVVGASRCTMLLVGPTGGSRADFSGLGLFSRAAYHDSNLIGCVAYPEDATNDFDAPFQASRIFGAITGFLLTAVFFLCTLLLFFKQAKEEIWIIMRTLLPCATVSQLLVFVAFKTRTCSASDLVQCRPGPTGIIVIFNVFLLVILSVGFCMIPPPPGPIFRFHNSRTDSSTMTSRQSRQYGDGAVSTPERPHSQKPNHTRRVVAVRPPGSPLSVTSLDLPSLQHSPCTNSSPQNTTSSNGSAPKRVRITTEPAETIMVQVEFSEKEKRTTKTITHPDGSKTITTTIERFSDSNDKKIAKKNRAPSPPARATSPTRAPPPARAPSPTRAGPVEKVKNASDRKSNDKEFAPKQQDAVASPVRLQNTIEASDGGPQVPEFFLKLGSLKKTNCLSAQEMAEQAKQESCETSDCNRKTEEETTNDSQPTSNQTIPLPVAPEKTAEIVRSEENTRPILPKAFFEQKQSVPEPTPTDFEKTEAPAEPPSDPAPGVKSLRQMFEKGTRQ